MRILPALLALLLLEALCGRTAMAHDPSPAAPSLLNLETSDLPQGRVRINGIERTHPANARTPWHTSGPKIIYVMEGTLTAYGLAGVRLLECGPAPKMCFLNPQGKMWYFRNHGPAAVRFVLVGVDAVAAPTIHEEVSEVAAIDGNRLTIALGDLRSKELLSPRAELSFSLEEPAAVKVGDDVVTIRHDKKSGKATTVLRLHERWQ